MLKILKGKTNGRTRKKKKSGEGETEKSSLVIHAGIYRGVAGLRIGKPKIVRKRFSTHITAEPAIFVPLAWVYLSVEEAGMMRENWTKRGEDNEEGKRERERDAAAPSRARRRAKERKRRKGMEERGKKKGTKGRVAEGQKERGAEKRLRIYSAMMIVRAGCVGKGEE